MQGSKGKSLTIAPNLRPISDDSSVCAKGPVEDDVLVAADDGDAEAAAVCVLGPALLPACRPCWVPGGLLDILTVSLRVIENDGCCCCCLLNAL